ncbi:MAG: ABC-F family ATP-binding cassette domain-containing protein [Ignavibacteria bacterium]|nr:ABC-F family ATP-binding cassette domain-containing protein [Ignavibacteria bacterium]
MTIFSCNSLTKAYFEKVLFRGVAFGMQSDERVGIIGRNGAGKTSLLRIVAGIDEPDEGTFAVNNDARIEYLEQLPSFDVHDTALHAVTKEYNQEHGHLEDWEIETRARLYLGKLGLEDVQKDVHSMSGGQRKRVAIARALMSEPDLLILDEPTNHLDADSVQWLQDELQSSSRALLLVTHDRYFLDAVCNRIVELDQLRLISYDGGYERYLELKEQMMSVQDATAEHDRNKLRKELAWLAKGAKARRTKQKSRIDWIAKMQAEPERVDIRDIEIEVGNKKLGGKIIDAVDVQVSINGKVLFTDFTYRAKPLDKIGIIGPNGAGKSTLLNTLCGKIQAEKGYANIGETVQIGYFAQEVKDLSENETVIWNVRDIAEYIDVGVGRERYITAKELCDRFAFSSKQQHAYVHTLSGGERRRLALLRILMGNPNVLFLDEPTNDFDIETLGALEDYLQFFKGVLLVVSHDRAFLDKTVDTIWSFEEHGKIKEYPGNYSDYLEKKESKGKAKSRKKEAAEQVRVDASAKKDVVKISFSERKELEKLPKQIEKLESRKSELELQLGSGETPYMQLQKLSAEFETIGKELDTVMKRWMELVERS